MKTFEFPSNVQFPSSKKPAKEDSKQQDKPSRGPGGGFFGGFGTASKNKKATLSKEAQAQKNEKMQQYRDILGVQGNNASNQNKRSAAENDWVIESALRKAN